MSNSEGQSYRFSPRRFLGVMLSGALFAFCGGLVLLAIGFLARKDEASVLPEGYFNVIGYILLAFVIGGIYSGGAYLRNLWKLGDAIGVVLGGLLGSIIGAIYFPLQVFFINPLLCQSLRIPYNNKTTMIEAILIGFGTATFFMVLGYWGAKDKEPKPAQLKKTIPSPQTHSSFSAPSPSKQQPDALIERKCHNCGTKYRLSDYSKEAHKWFCSSCKYELPKE